MRDFSVKYIDFLRFIVLEKYKFVFCFLLKVFCIVWKNFLVDLEGVYIEKDVYYEIRNKFNFL